MELILWSGEGGLRKKRIYSVPLPLEKVVVDEKSIPTLNILWDMAVSIPYLVPNQYQEFIPPINRLKIPPLFTHFSGIDSDGAHRIFYDKFKSSKDIYRKTLQVSHSETVVETPTLFVCLKTANVDSYGSEPQSRQSARVLAGRLNRLPTPPPP
jgi:hypothetical protein